MLNRIVIANLHATSHIQNRCAIFDKMNEIKLYKKPTKVISLLAISTVFVVLGIWGVMRDGNSAVQIIMAYLTIFLFGLGIAVGFFHLFDRRPQIIINENGIWDRTTNLDLIKWELIQNAYPINIYGQIFISLKLDENMEVKVKQYKWATYLSNKMDAQKINLSLGQIKIDYKRLNDFILKMTKLEQMERRKEILKVVQNGI